jgi:hypothetical protein
MRTNCLLPGHREKRLGKICLSDDLSRRITLITHHLPSWRLKNDFGEFDESQRTHFLHCGLGRSRLSDVLSRRMVPWTQNLSAGRLKKLLWWSRWSDVSRWRKATRINFQHPEHWDKWL